MVKLHIWDTSGQERFRAMTNLYYRDAQVAILTYDITNESSFNSIEFWIKELRYKVENENMILCLVGNKCDVNSNEKKVTTLKGKNFAAEHNMIFFETSALSGNNIANAFNSSIQVIHNLILNNNFSEEELSNNGIRIEKNNSNDIQINKMKMGIKNSNIDCCKM